MKIPSSTLVAVIFFGAFFAMMSFAGAEWKGIEVEADEANFEISYEAGSDKSYRIVFTEDGVKSVFMFGESGCVTTMEVGSEVYDVEDADDGDDVTVKLKSSTRRLHSENHTNREDKGEDQHRFDSRRLYACDDCETTWDVVCDEGVPCVCNLRDFGAPLSAAAEHAVETLCEKFGNACSTDGGEEACDGQCILSPTLTPTPPPSGKKLIILLLAIICNCIYNHIQSLDVYAWVYDVCLLHNKIKLSRERGGGGFLFPPLNG